MNDLDHRIRAALQGTPEGHALATDPNLAAELLAAFRTRHRWLHGFAFLLTLVFFLGSLWAGYRLVATESLPERIGWACLCTVGLMFVGFLKLYFFLEMHTNRVLRELKRVELLLLQRLQ